MARKKKKTKRQAETDQPELSFEDSLSELQQIVEELEEGRLGLEESMQRFEQGIALLRNCYRTLEAAEQKIEILTGTDDAGNPLTKPFDAAATVDESQPTTPRSAPAGQTQRATRRADDSDDPTGTKEPQDQSPERLF